MIPRAPLDPDVEAAIARSMEVLVVDDNDCLRKVMRYALEDAGYSVYEASIALKRSTAYVRIGRVSSSCSA